MNSRALSRLVSIIPRDFTTSWRGAVLDFHKAINLPKKYEEEIEWHGSKDGIGPLGRLESGGFVVGMPDSGLRGGMVGDREEEDVTGNSQKGLVVSGLEINHLLAGWSTRTNLLRVTP